ISQPSSSGADEETGSKLGVLDVPTDESEEELSWNSTDDEGDDNEEKDDDGDEEDEGDNSEEGNGDDDNDEDDDGRDDNQEYDDEYTKETRDEESFDPIPQTPENSKDEGNGEEDLSLNICEEERHIEEEDEDELYKDVNINQGMGLQASLEVEDSHVTLTLVNLDGQQQSSSVSSQFVTSMLNLTLDVGMESIFETTSQSDVPTPTSVAPLPITALTMTHSTIATITTTSQAPILPTTVLSNIIQNLPNFGSLFRFDDRLRSLEANFSEFRQTNQFARVVSSIPEIVNQYIDQRMNEAVKVVIQIQFDRLRDEAQRENAEFLRTVDENMKKIIKKQVKEQVKAQVSKILPRIEKAVNEQLEAEVLTRSSHSSRTSYAVAADLSEMEIKKILIEKMEGNKSIQRSDEQRNLFKALVDAYEFDKIILDTYEETRCREGKPESASALTETDTKSAGLSTQGSRSRQASASESSLAEEPMQTTSQMEEPSYPRFDTGADDQPIVQSSQHPEWFSQQQKPPSPNRDWNKTVPAVHASIQPWISELATQADTRSSFNELMDTPLDFFNFIINQLKVDTLTPELPAGQQYPHNLLKPLLLIQNNQGRRVIPFKHFINNDLEYLRGGASSRKYTTSIMKTKAVDYGHIKWMEDLVPRTMWIKEPIGYDKHALWGRRIIAVTKLKTVEWHSYKHVDWIMVRRDDDKLYKFKEGDFKRLRIQDIEDMLLLLVQCKLTNLIVEERFSFNVSLQMFTRSIVIQRRVEDLQLGVESYQKKLNLTKPDSYRSDLKRKEAYTAYSNLRGFIYQNKDKRNRLMQIDKLHKFRYRTLTDVRTALDDRLKGIWM
nr:hypothetical protein [Tanacetum cinerariifolium]